MSRFVRQSSYRHVFGTPAKKEKVYDNIKISASAWDTNLVSASEKYIAVNYQSSGGGAFLVTPLDQTGKLPDLFPLCRAHTAPVLDTAWSPFNDSLVASAGEDGRVAVTYIDETILSQAFNNETSEVRDFEPVSKFAAHGRKAGHVVWHPTAEGILASASTEVKIWDVGAEKNVYTGETHSDMVQSLTWDYCGTTYATTCKDKKLRLFDPRAGSAAVVVADSHSGIKGSRVAWMGSLDRIVTTGFSKSSERQVYVWDSRDLMKGPIKSLSIDQSSGTLMPFWNQGNNILFLAGKGDGNIRYYEYENDDLFYLTEYTSHSPQRGMCFLPPRALNANDNEIARAFKCVGTTVEPISFVVPRKSDSFQSDLFPPAASSTAPLTAEKWLSGSNATPILLDMETRQTAAADSTPTPAPYVRSTPAVTATPRAAVATVSTPAPAPAHTPVAVSTPTPTPTASAPAPTPQAPITNRVLEAPKIDTPAAPTAPISAAQSQQTNGSSNDAEVESLKELVERLKKDNESLKEEVAERDTLIRGLELKLEKVKSAFS